MKKENVWLWSFLLLSFSSTAQQKTEIQAHIEATILELSTLDEWGTALIPPATKLIKIETGSKRLSIYLDLPKWFLINDIEAETQEEIIEHFAVDLSTFAFSEIAILARKDQHNFVPLSDFITDQPIAPNLTAKNSEPLAEQRTSQKTKRARLEKEAQPQGILSGKTVWLSAGHGWQYDRRKKCFKTQRQNHHSVVEDFASIESVNYYLLKYLYNAGANVWTVRERDMNANEIIIDNDQGKPYYRETGKWQTSRTKGYQNSNYRYAISTPRETATASYQPEIKEEGLYWVSVHYKSGWNRAGDVRYHIFHAGGESVVSINQEVHGDTWVYLGQFYFEKGSAGKVVLSNATTDKKQAIVADAVRFGGGMGSVADCRYGKKSGEPRYEEAAKYYAVFQGYPICDNDVMIRPNYAEWELAKGTKEEQENAVYISWHTNGGKASGTESFTHAYNPIKGSWSLQKYIHEALVKDIKKAWDPNWLDRGKKAADFGELRGLRKMPGVLLEVAFHDNPTEAKALNTPEFREIAARAVYKGIVQYFAAKDRRVPVYAPEKPSEIVAANTKKNQVKLQWKASPKGGVYGHRAQSYRIHISKNGKGFRPAATSTTTNYTFKDLRPGQLYYFRITGLNRGGESLPSPVVAVRTPNSGASATKKFLIVDGFDRLDREMAQYEYEKLPRFAPLGKIRRLFLEEMNNYDNTRWHAEALADANVPFDGATNEAVTNKYLKLENYQMVNWFLGKESVASEALNPAEIKLLKKYLDAGGNLLISGSEIAYHLDKKAADPNFLKQYLKASYRGDDARSGQLKGKKRSDFAGFSARFNQGIYQLTPDFIHPTAEAETILQYANDKVAAVGYKGKYKMLYFAFPIEKIASEEMRSALFEQSLAYFEIKPVAKEVIVANVPNSIKKSLVLQLKNTPEGKVSFRLLDRSGKAVFQKTWAHQPHQKEKIHFPDLRSARYRYELTVLGQIQKGFISKE
ncbi:MAG: N-acetylmuramoyl-L-alanine amidase [Saprospiraceae bacterium]